MNRKHAILAVLSLILAVALVQGGFAAPAAEKAGDQGKVVTLKYFTVEHTNWPVKNDTPVLQEMTKRIGIKLDYIVVPGEVLNEKLNLTMASGDLPDLMNLNVNYINQNLSSGAFLALNDLVDNTAPRLAKKMTPTVKKYVVNQLDGKYYGIPLMGTARYKEGWLVRGDWLSKLGLKEPDTLDDWITVLRAFRDKDPDGNGKNDTIPFTYYAGTMRTNAILSNSFGFTEWWWSIIDGKPVYNPTHPRYKEAITWLANAYKEKLWDQEFVTASTKQWEERLSSGAAGATHGNLARSDMFNAVGRKINPSYNMIGVTPPAGPRGERGYNTYSSTLPGYVTAVTKGCKNVDAAMKYLDFWFSDEGSILSTMGIKGVTYDVKDGKEVYIGEMAAPDAGTNIGLWAKWGINQQMFPRNYYPVYYDLVMGPNTKEAAKKAEAYFKDPFPPLSFTKEESARVKEIVAAVEPMANQYMDRMVMGELPLTQWDAFQTDMKKAGVDELNQIYGAAYQRFVKFVGQ
jgi:putative aldouronate transport system substrate-binding protein